MRDDTTGSNPSASFHTLAQELIGSAETPQRHATSQYLLALRDKAGTKAPGNILERLHDHPKSFAFTDTEQQVFNDTFVPKNTDTSRRDFMVAGVLAAAAFAANKAADHLADPKKPSGGVVATNLTQLGFSANFVAVAEVVKGIHSYITASKISKKASSEKNELVDHIRNRMDSWLEAQAHQAQRGERDAPPL